MDLRQTYNLIAESWHTDHHQDDWWMQGTDRFASMLPPNGRVLDVGCGAGTKSKYLTKKGLQVIGIDFAENMIAIARREAPEALYMVGDFTQPKNLPSGFDGIFMQATLLHVPRAEAETVVRGLGNKLKSGGYFYIAVKGPRTADVLEEITTEHKYGTTYNRNFSYFTEADLISLFERLNYIVIFHLTERSGKTDWVQVIAQK